MAGDRRLFGTDGIRGVANEEPMTSETALALGRALAHISQKGKRHKRILIGKDTRLSGYMLETALASGITSMGADVLLVGPMPTPGVSFLTQGMRAAAGVMVSASHNPFADNGLKVFDSDGVKFPDEKEQELENLMLSGELIRRLPHSEKIGRAFRVEEAQGRYIEYLKGSFPRGENLEGFKLVLDCAHGASYQIAPTVFEELGAEVISLGVEPNGFNINEDCGAMFPQKMATTVRESGAQLGIALDGDADRVIFADEKGQVIGGDAILAICAGDLLNRGRLRHKTVVGTVMSNLGLEEYLKRQGGKLLRTQVGDRYIATRMKEGDYLLGGESSGHLIFGEYGLTGDGILSALQLLSLLQRNGKAFSELLTSYVAYPQVMKNVRVKKQTPLEGIESLQKLIQKIEGFLGDQGRVLVRYSGTEPLVRIMIEGKDRTRIQAWADELAFCLETSLT